MSPEKRALLAAALLAATFVPGCRSVSSREATGAGIGALAGGGAGYALGRHYGSRSAGTLIGAGVGGLLGYVVGDALDEREAERAYGGRPIDGLDRWSSAATTHPCVGCDDPPPPPCR